ncbi:MAG: hypothetical protein ABIW57_00955, partial [Polyangia bacterium]
MLVVTLAVSGCKSSSTPPQGDSGAVDRPGGGDGAGTCTNDDGMRNKLKGQACTCDLQCSSGFCADG